MLLPPYIDCSAIAWFTESSVTAGVEYTLTCNTLSWGTDCTVSMYFIFRGDELKSNRSTLTFAPFKLSDINYYTCIATVNGFNFTSNPTLIQNVVQSKLPLIHAVGIQMYIHHVIGIAPILY